jgi:hypothetical protein
MTWKKVTCDMCKKTFECKNPKCHYKNPIHCICKECYNEPHNPVVKKYSGCIYREPKEQVKFS